MPEFKEQAPINEPKGKELSANEILEMNPRQLADFFAEMQKKEELEEFLEKAAKNDSLVAQFSYWEKWLKKGSRILVDEIVAEKRKIYDGKEDNKSLPLHLEKKFTHEELELIFSSTKAIQLTFGCSKGCPFCGFDAVKGVREHIPYSQLANLFQKYGKELNKNKPMLYFASEPSDYTSTEGLEDKTYKDIHQLAIEFAGYYPVITTKNTNDEQWLESLNVQAMGTRAGVSVYGMAMENIAEIEQKHRKNLVMLGAGIEHLKGIGLSFNQEEENKNTSFKAGIFLNSDGVLITPRGIYGVAEIAISKDYPQGIIIAPLEKISGIEIKVGDKLKNVLSHSIIINPPLNNWTDTSIKSIFEFTSRYSDEIGNTYSNSARDKIFNRIVFIKTKTKTYQVRYDDQGRILAALEIDLKKIEREEEILKKNFEKIIIKELEMREGDGLERYRQPFVDQGTNVAINNANEKKDFVFHDKNLTKEQIIKIKNAISQTNFSNAQPYGTMDRDEWVPVWYFKKGFISMPEFGVFHLKAVVKDRPRKRDKIDKISLIIFSDHWLEEPTNDADKDFDDRLQTIDKRKEGSNTNDIINAIKNNEFEFLKFFEEAARKKIIQYVLENSQEIKQTLKDKNRFVIDIPDIGKISLSLIINYRNTRLYIWS